MVTIEQVERLFNFQDVCFSQSWSLVRFGIELGLTTLLAALDASAHRIVIKSDMNDPIKFNSLHRVYHEK
jgi:hypothetical protein